MKQDLSIKDIAQLSGVSIATVSRYFNGQSIRSANKEKLEQVLDETGYRPNAAARSMKGRTTGTIGIIVPKVSQYFFATLTEGVINRAREAGYSVFVGSSEGNTDIERKSISIAAHSLLDGLIYIPVSRTEALPDIAEFRNLPLVIAARTYGFSSCPHVVHDGEKGGYLATKYLLRLGRRNIAFFGSFWDVPVKNSEEFIHFVDTPESGAYSTCDRFKGYRKALEEEGIPLDPKMIILAGYTYESGQQAAEQLIASFEPCNGVIINDQVVANGSLARFRSQHLQVPDDISIIVFDDEDRSHSFPYTRVNLHLKEMGRLSADILFKLIDGKPVDHITKMDVSLVPQETTSIWHPVGK